MATAHYVTLVYSFALDIENAGELRGRGPDYWIETGLCTTEEEVTELFEAVDTILDKAEEGDSDSLSLVDHAYFTHGRFLNILSSLHGESPHQFPDMPEAPSFASKHAPFADYQPAKKSKSRKPTKKLSAKAQGKQKAKSPIILPPSSEESQVDENASQPASGDEADGEVAISGSGEEDEEEVDELDPSQDADAIGSPEDADTEV